MTDSKEQGDRGRMLKFNSAAKDWPEDLFPNGRCRFSYRTRNEAERELYNETINRLREDGEYDILRACQKEALRIDEVHQKLTTAQSRSHALEELRAEMRDAGFRSAPAFGDIVDRYLDEYSSKKTSGTRKRHQATLSKFRRQELEGRPVEEHRIDRLDEFQLDRVLQNLNVASGTKETYRRTLAGMYSWYMQWELAQHRTKGRPRRVTYNPASEVERRQTGGDVTTLTEHQIGAVLDRARPHERFMFRTIAELGLRANEAVHLRKDLDVDLERGIIRIQPRGPDPDHKCEDCQADGWWPKRPRHQDAENNSIRTLHLPDEKQPLLEALRRHARMWPVESGDYFFQNPSVNSSGPFTYETLRYRFKRACDQTDDVVTYGQKKKGGVTLHSLRHTCATQMIRSEDVSLAVAAQVLGHTVSTLEDTYEHLLDEDTRLGLRVTATYGTETTQSDAQQQTENAGDQSAPQPAPEDQPVRMAG